MLLYSALLLGGKHMASNLDDLDNADDLFVKKEALIDSAVGISSLYTRLATEKGVPLDKLKHPLIKKSIEIYGLKWAIRDAETMDELKMIDEKLSTYASDLDNRLNTIAGGK
jgi:hypothetical protein